MYCVSLNDKDLTESELCSLFDSLPDRCIVLLEDIDSAGLKREEEPVIVEVPEDSKADIAALSGFPVLPEPPKTVAYSGDGTYWLDGSRLFYNGEFF